MKNLHSRSILYSIYPEYSQLLSVESLSSYITRLANLHCVSTQIIIDIILKTLDKPYSYSQRREYSSISYGINGIGKLSTEWIESVSQLSTQENLDKLTLNFLGSYCRPINFVKKYKSWCPTCFHQMMNESLTLFEPLLWFFSPVDICPIHLSVLVNRCPRCHNQIPVLGSKSKIGCCSYCDTWLGNESTQPQSVDDESKWKTSFCKNLLDLNQNNYLRIGKNVNLNIQDFLFCDEYIGNLDQNFVAQIFGVHLCTLKRWEQGERIFLSSFLDGCYLLGNDPLKKTPQNLVEEEITTRIKNTQYRNSEIQLLNVFSDIDNDEKNGFVASIATSKSVNDFCRRINVRPIVLKLKNPEIYSLIERKIQNKEKNKYLISFQINKCIGSKQNIPIYQISEEINIPLRSLRKYVPNICRRISIQNSNHRKFLKTERQKFYSMKAYQITQELLFQGKHPSGYRIAKALPRGEILLNKGIQSSIEKAKKDFYCRTRKTGITSQ